MAKLFHTFSSIMYFHRTIIFFLLFQFKEIVPTRAFRLENDITKLLDTWFAKIFAIDGKIFAKLFPYGSNYKMESFEYTLTHRENPSERNFYFKDMEFLDITSQTPSFYCKFSGNKKSVKFEEIHVRVNGEINTEKHTRICIQRFHTILRMKNFTITTPEFRLGQSNNSITNNKKNLYLISYDDVPSTYWDCITKKDDVLWFGTQLFEHGRLPIEKKEQITRELTPVLPIMFIENLNRDSKFNSIVSDEIFQLSRPDEEILAMHSDFLNNSKQFHYLIPKRFLGRFALKRIVTRGLWNVDSFTANTESGIWTQALLIRNVEGSLTLDYLYKNETSLKMKFHIDCLYIIRKSNCIMAEAKYYNVTRGKASIPLTFKQSEVIMNGIESAIAASVAPTIRVGRMCELKTPVEEIQIANTSDWNAIKKAYKGWIPFNDDITTIGLVSITN